MTVLPLATSEFLALARERLRSEPPDLSGALANPRGDHTLDDVPLSVVIAVIKTSAEPVIRRG